MGEEEKDDDVVDSSNRINSQLSDSRIKSTPTKHRLDKPAWMTEDLMGNFRSNPRAFVQDVSEVISSTDISISGTVDVYKNMVKDLNDQLVSNNPTQIQIKNITEKLSVLDIKMEDLEKQKDSLQKVQVFIKDNLEFILFSTEARGRLMGVESRLDALEKRIGYVEDERKNVKQNRLAVWAIIISIIGIITSILIALYG